MTNRDQIGLLLLGMFLAVGISVGGYFIGQTMYNAKVALNTAEVKGLAERRVNSDRANWKINFTITGKTRNEIPKLYKLAETNQATIVDLLKQNGFDSDEITVGILDYEYKEFRDENQRLVDQKHELIGSIRVETGNVEIISKARASVNKLMAQGIDIENNSPAYRFTKLNEIKPDMLKEATHNARIAAKEFAENAGVNVGSIRSARQGIFRIRDAGEEYGDTNKIEKDVRVITNITFYLTD
ncbi:MAG: SIMPL domain-containing protein [Deltaproteobacteria bacterium]|nr:SIMPL domain-containing protein [Deltaproteobacteria bacterium]